jgi:multiple sugar transport system ATP-binding protein
MSRIVLRGLTKSFGRTPVIRGVDLSIGAGEFVVFVGPSGCGKSTLLRLVAGLEDPDDGEILIDDVVVNDLTPKERGVAMVFQSYALYPHMSAYDNMAFGLELARQPRDAIDARVRQAAERLRIADLLDRKPRELSGGQRQRVAIGRAIVRDPKVFLFDEPLSNLDAALRVQTRIEIAALHRDSGATMVYVTHDQVEAMTLADTIVVLHAGRIEQVGRPLDLYHRPANLFVAGFIGSPRMNVWDGEVARIAGAVITVNLAGGGPIDLPAPPRAFRQGDRISLGIRPEHVILGGPDLHLVRGRVELVEPLGESSLVHVRVAGDRLVTARVPGDAAVRSGIEVGVGIPAKLCHLFDASGRSLAAASGAP